jgi:hypothetical protein
MLDVTLSDLGKTAVVRCVVSPGLVYFHGGAPDLISLPYCVIGSLALP